PGRAGRSDRPPAPARPASRPGPCPDGPPPARGVPLPPGISPRSPRSGPWLRSGALSSLASRANNGHSAVILRGVGPDVLRDRAPRARWSTRRRAAPPPSHLQWSMPTRASQDESEVCADPLGPIELLPGSGEEAVEDLRWPHATTRARSGIRTDI